MRPSLLLDFANSRRLDARIQFTRASAGTYFDRNGALKTAAANEPRFDHEPATGICRGLLIEEARTNLLTYSDQLHQGAWTKSGVSVIPSAHPGPDGLLSAAKLVESNGVESHTIYQGVAKAAAAQAYAVTFFLRAGERSAARLYLSSGSTSNAATCVIDLATGAVTALSSTTAFSSPAVRVIALADGWWAISLSATSDALTTIRGHVYVLPSTTSSASYAGDGVSGLYVWAGQLEAGAFATSYIPTAGAAATRAADVATISGAALAPWFNQAESTILVEADTLSTQSDNTIFCIDDGTTTQASQIDARFVASANTIRARARSGNASTLGDLVMVVPSVATPCRTAVAFAAHNAAGSSGGGAVSTDTSGAMPSSELTRLVLGDRAATGGADMLNGHIARLAYYPRRLSNADLVELTR